MTDYRIDAGPTDFIAIKNCIECGAELVSQGDHKACLLNPSHMRVWETDDDDEMVTFV